VLATLDTKGLEARYLREQIQSLDCDALIVDVGVVGEPGTIADISRDEVARAGGSSLEALLKKPDREVAAPIMADGATKLILEMAEAGKIHGMVAMGGTQGTTLASKVMRALPYGFPKVLVSTMASGNVAPWVDIKDITMIFSVTDIMGLNRMMKKFLANAAGAVCGMALNEVEIERGGKPLVGVTTVGITTVGAMKAVEVLEAAGYETIIFHAIGPGGRAMEQMMREGIICAVLDYSIIEVSNEMFPALLAGGPDRLTTAGKLGIPQVICPGAVEVLVFNEPETVPQRYAGRKLIRHSPQITDLRLNGDEMAELGKEVARRLQHTQSDAVFFIPKGGYDSYAVTGEGFHDPEADDRFVVELKTGLPQNIEIVERDADINNLDFAAETARRLIELMEKRGR
jgi:uncharacterized protein (UPF0261 family)